MKKDKKRKNPVRGTWDSTLLSSDQCDSGGTTSLVDLSGVSLSLISDSTESTRSGINKCKDFGTVVCTFTTSVVLLRL